MSIAETLNVVRDAAQMLTRDGKVLTFASTEFPLAQFADSYNVEEDPKPVELTEEAIVAVEDHFEEVNEDSIPLEEDTREALVENTHLGLSRTLFTTNNVIIPAIKEMHSYFAGLQARTSQPEYRVEPFVYSAIHNSPTLVNHVNTRYIRVRPQPSYRTFRLNPISADAIIENIAVNNPHLEQEEVTEWALTLGAERIEKVWFSLFGESGNVNINDLPYMTLQAAPFSVDDIALAYFICGHYMDNPERVPGADVDIDEWQVTMLLLHECFGFYLAGAYLNRMDMRERGELILRNEATNPVETRRAVVIVNNDVSAPWLIAGGDIQAVLGAAIDNPGITLLEQIEKGSEHYIKRWCAVYPLIKQAAIDYADRQTRNDVIKTFLEMARTGPLAELPINEIDGRMQQAMRELSRDDLRNPYKTFASLIVDVYFPNTNYKLFLEAIDEYGQDFPAATIRELNTQAIITLTAIFLAKQISVARYVPDIDPNAVVTEEDETDFDTNLVAIEIDEEDAPVAPELVVDDISEVDDVEIADDIEMPVDDDTSDFEDDAEDDPYAEVDGIQEGADEAADDDIEAADNAEEEETDPK